MISKNDRTMIILGDDRSARFHSLAQLEEMITVWREEGWKVTVLETYKDLTEGFLNQYSLCVNYIDNWGEQGSEEAEAEILRYVHEGGQLLTLHNGIILKDSEQLLQMHGGSFNGHAEYSQLVFQKKNYHEVTEGMEEFSIMEEPYEFIFYPSEEKVEILSYVFRNKTYPAGWVRKIGKGNLVYLCFGHSSESFRNEYVQKLCVKAAQWLVSQYMDL